MKEVPYQKNHGDTCALSCYTMMAQYLLPSKNVPFDELSKISKWHKGYVVWGYPAWSWMMDNGVQIHNYDIINVQSWADKGTKGLKESVAPEEFEYYKAHTYNLEDTTADLRLALNHPHFTYTQGKITWKMIVDEINKPGICDLTLNGYKLHSKEGFSVHRIVILEIKNDEVIFHDPTENGDGAYTRTSLEHFQSAISSLPSGSELTRYSLA